jgi:3-carboxy-cis,cis-muconate cycloisomerase
LTLRELAGAAASGLAAMAEVLQGLQVNVGAMAANLERTQGLVFSEALSLRLSREVADRLVEQAVREDRHLKDVAAQAGVLGAQELGALFDATRSFGSAGAMVERVLEDWATARESAT